jgi:hypothetical protein
MAELSELVPGSRWFDLDGDESVVLRTNGDGVFVAWYERDDDEWKVASYDPEEGETFKGWRPFLTCPDFERFVGFELEGEHGDVDTRLDGLIYGTYVFQIGVREGKPFIEAVTK